jgi:hypothetical protein
MAKEVEKKIEKRNQKEISEKEKSGAGWLIRRRFSDLYLLLSPA